MPGVKGAGGPPPKRSDQRRRTNPPAAGAPTKAPAGKRPAAPKGDPKWHPVARRWFASLAASGQSKFYEASDWAVAELLAESISRELSPQPMSVGQGKDAHIEMVSLPPKGASLAAWLQGMTRLLATEGDRRRAALELTVPSVPEEKGGADVTKLDEFRRRLS